MNGELICSDLINLLEDYKAQEVLQLSVSEMTSLFDTFFICTGTSTRHVKTIADKIVRHFKAKMPQTPRAEGLERCEWVLIDLGDVIVHIMLAETRAFYRLEQLWTCAESEKPLSTNS